MDIAAEVAAGVCLVATVTAAIGLFGKLFTGYVTHVPEDEHWADPLWRWDRLAMFVRWFRPACVIALASAAAFVSFAALS